MPLQHVHHACPCCKTLLHFRSARPAIHVSPPCCMSMLHIRATCTYCLFMIYFPCCMPLLHYPAEHRCCIPVSMCLLHVFEM
jgi:hypothetical protein